MTRSFCEGGLKRGFFGKEVNYNLLGGGLELCAKIGCKVYKIRKTINKKRTEKLLISIEYVILDVGKCIPSA